MRASMKTIRPAAAALLALAAVTTTGCATLLDLLRTTFREPALTFKSVNLTDISLAGLTLDTTWQLTNPNAVGLSLASVDYALFIDDKQVLAGAPAQGFQVAAQGSTDLHFPAGIKFADLAAVLETFLSKDTARWRAEGGLGVQTPIGLVRLPLSHQGDFEVPKLPLVQFQDPRVTNVSLSGATIEFPLIVTNRNTYALPVNGLSGTVSIGGSPVGTLSTGDLGAMSGKGARTVALPLSVNFFSAAGAVVNAVRGGNAQVRFDARLQSGGTNVPLNIDQAVKFIR
jgi:LEA14-like dessication related protein